MVMNNIQTSNCSLVKRVPRPIGEVITEMLLQGNAPLAVAYRKHIAECKAEEASTITSIEKGGEDGKNRI